jgi:hypothetical protein
VKERLLRKPGGDRQFVSILQAVGIEGLEPVTVACELALEAGTPSAEVVLNILHRFKPQPSQQTVPTPDGLRLRQEPKADVTRYDALLKKLCVTLVVGMPLISTAGALHATR